MVGQSKVYVSFRALVREFESHKFHLKDLTPSSCFRAIAVSLAIDPTKLDILPFREIEYEGHHHSLRFTEKSSSELHQCNAYDTYCKQPVGFTIEELSKTKPFVLSCKVCVSDFHLLCGPLPSTIEDECHLHPLNLVDSFLEDETDEYYCDLCEERRDPRICVYLCVECRYIAHVHCLISKVSGVLKGDYGDANLRVANELLLSADMAAGASKKLKALCSASDNSFDSDIDDGHHHDEEGVQDIDHEDYRNMKSRIKAFFDKERPRLKLPSKNLEVKMVPVGEYMVPWTLAPILEILRHSGLEEEVRPSNFHRMSRKMKSRSFAYLCQIINSMRINRVRYINERILSDWFCLAMFLESLGFRIRFLFEHLKRVRRAYFGMQARKFENETPTTLTRQIKEGKREIEMLEQKLEDTKKEKARREEKLRKYMQLRAESISESHFLSKCLNEASILSSKNAGDDLFK